MMKRFYMDWNIFTQLKNPIKEPFIGIANTIAEIKDFVFIPYSTAHLSDLKKGYKKEEPNITFTNIDLKYLSETCRNFHWYYSEEEKSVKYIIKNPIDAFEPYKEVEISVAETMDFKKLFEDMEGMEGMESVGEYLNNLLEAIQVPLDFTGIPDSSELKKPLQDMFGATGKTTSLLALMKGLSSFSDEINVDPTKYKNLRNGFRNSLQLSSDMSNWNKDTWKQLDTHLSATVLNKSFTDLVIEGTSQNKNKEVTFYDEFISAYMSLDLVGFNPEGLNKKNTYANLFNDAQHAFFAAHSNVFVTNDVNTKAKAKAIYDKYQIPTEILTPDEFLLKLNTEIKVIELFNTALNGMKLDHLILTRVPNLDGSDFDYKIVHIDFPNGKKIMVGTCDLILGYISFVETKGIGIPHGAMKLLYNWIDANMEK
jgi:hypothetical protein